MIQAASGMLTVWSGGGRISLLFPSNSLLCFVVHSCQSVYICAWNVMWWDALKKRRWKRISFVLVSLATIRRLCNPKIINQICYKVFHSNFTSTYLFDSTASFWCLRHWWSSSTVEFRCYYWLPHLFHFRFQFFNFNCKT
jgi:hypothetical protein